MHPIGDCIKNLLKEVDHLRELYPHKRFTLDGRLVGDIGEVLVSEAYGIKLFEKIEKKHDGISSDGRNVQIKATFKDSLYIASEKEKVPDYYIGIRIFEDGSFEELYNGPGTIIFEAVRHRKAFRGEYIITNKKLKELNQNIPSGQQINKNPRSK